MKISYKKYITLIIFCALSIYSFLPVSLGQTILGDSIFPLEKDESIRWKNTNSTEPYYDEIEYIRFTSTDVYNTSTNGNRYMFVNYTLEFYHKFAWIPKSLDDINAFYLSYNASLNFLNWSRLVYQEAYLFVIPVPINLTLVSSAIVREGILNSTIVGNNTLILDYYNATSIEVSFNVEGISTVIEKKLYNTTIFRWELMTNDVIIIIPLGYSFLFFIIIGIVFIISTKKFQLRKRVINN